MEHWKKIHTLGTEVNRITNGWMYLYIQNKTNISKYKEKTVKAKFSKAISVQHYFMIQINGCADDELVDRRTGTNLIWPSFLKVQKWDTQSSGAGCGWGKV